ncbi:MAG TPA: hypothetical protein VFB12_32220 [Ktedonobacteraceae bacterium]|nr:hypothetical protein [Ktedonobacteraceae bacterium]
MSKTQPRQERRRDRREDQRRRDRREDQRRREAELRAARKRRNTIMTASIIGVAVIIVAAVSYFIFVAPKAQSSVVVDSSGTPVSQQVNPPIDNIRCDVGEKTTYHVHAHLSLYINGQQVPVSQGIGISADGTCFYWLHTHDTSGVIHVEASQKETFTLGTFFKLWAEEFPQLQYPLQLDQTSGWQVYVDGKPYKGDFRNIELSSHTLITMAYNTTGVPPDTTYNWNGL